MEMQMDPSDVVDYVIVIVEDNCDLGTIQCRKGCTYADIRHEIVDDEIFEYPFDFIVQSNGHALNSRQEEKRTPPSSLIGIKRKAGTMVAKTLGSRVMEGTPISKKIEGNVEEPMHKQPRVDNMSESLEQVVVDPNVLAY